MLPVSPPHLLESITSSCKYSPPCGNYFEVLKFLWLSNLCKGKKYNPLKERIDSCDYDIDQLLLGTLFFTVIFFLLPTTMIYYINFMIVKMGVSMIRGTLDFVSELLGHFPLFGVFLYFSSNQLLPGKQQLQESFTHARWHTLRIVQSS